MDVLKEIAFLCMDLEAFKKYRLSDYLLKTYSEQSLNNELRLLFTYYKALLANVRAKASALQAMQQNENDPLRQRLKESLKYINLMHTYMSLL
jgi:aminoglycoside phosphotransferase family enzyme